MKRYLYITYIISTVVTLIIPTNQHIAEEPHATFINSIEDDVSGDGLKEYLKLQGELLSDDSGFYQNVWLEVMNPFAKEWTISLKGGYHPTLMLYDMNQDKVNDLIYQVALDEEGKHYSTQIYTLSNDKVKQLTLPENNQIKGKYVNDFRIGINFHSNEGTVYFSINNNKQLTDSNIYNRKGDLIKDIDLSIDPIKKYTPTLISKSKGYGLKSIQDVKNKDSNEVIGSIETLWYLNKDKWIILKNDWLPV